MQTIDLLTDAILPEAETVQAIARAADSYDATGKAVKGAETPEDIQAELQPMTGKNLEDLPEGLRESAQYMIWTGYALQYDQVVVYEGQRYRVIKVYPRRHDNFTKAALGRFEV